MKVYLKFFLFLVLFLAGCAVAPKKPVKCPTSNYTRVVDSTSWVTYSIMKCTEERSMWSSASGDTTLVGILFIWDDQLAVGAYWPYSTDPSEVVRVYTFADTNSYAVDSAWLPKDGVLFRKNIKQIIDDKKLDPDILDDVNFELIPFLYHQAMLH